MTTPAGGKKIFSIINSLSATGAVTHTNDTKDVTKDGPFPFLHRKAQHLSVAAFGMEALGAARQAGREMVGEQLLICLLLVHRGLSVDSKPELQRVLEHRRRNQVLRQKKEEEEAKKLQSPFEKELLKRHQRLDQVGSGCQPLLCCSNQRSADGWLRFHSRNSVGIPP